MIYLIFLYQHQLSVFIAFRLESTTLPAKKRHSAHRQNYLTITETSNIIEGRIKQTTPKVPDDIDFSIGSTTAKTRNVQEGNIEEIGGYTSTIRPETTTQDRSKQRHRRHHRRRYVSCC